MRMVMNKFIILLILPLVLTACSQTTQTTSGESYLAKYNNVTTVSTVRGDIDNIEEKIRQVATVEPILKFPARIGLARIDRGVLTTVPGAEIEAWMKTRDKIDKNFGEFVPVNPIIADMVRNSIAPKDTNVMNKIRLSAARQHLDAVLIYEVYSKSGEDTNILSIAGLTITGGFLLPSRALEAEGFASSMLIDVVQGYPYGTADVTVDKEEIFSTSQDSYRNKIKLSEKVKTKAALKLTQNVEKMFMQLHTELAEKCAKKR